MSRARFAILLAVAAVAVAGAAFAIGLQVLDDEGPDRPPAGPASQDDDGGTDGTDEGATSSTAPADVEDGPLPSPSWVLVVSSEGDEARAREVAEVVAAAGHAAGVLRSDDHPSLNPGFWVAYAGPYADADAARAARDEVHADGFTAAYVRCAGTVEDCGGDRPPGGDDAGDDPDDAA